MTTALEFTGQQTENKKVSVIYFQILDFDFDFDFVMHAGNFDFFCVSEFDYFLELVE